MHMAQSKRILGITMVVSVAVFGGIMEWRRRRMARFEKFYETFDKDAAQAGMIKDGVYQSILPDGTITKEPWE